MISERALGSLKYALNLLLCVIGAVLYIPVLLITLMQSWAGVPVLIQRLWEMVQLQVPLPVEHVQVQVWAFLLVAYFGLLSPMVVRLFRRVPFLRPLMIMGVTFHFGLAVTYFAMMISFALGNQNQAILASIAVTGVVLTRALMSWLFNAIPAEVLAFRPRYR